ncbi:competence protein CoiA [Ureibacillus sp. MALMAid1270]|uniref:competence protein CoiA n=1 Tax=Ureibacillus sp. MALMAid1270 TaxID=3411629 RepID=UPI003BA780EA
MLVALSEQNERFVLQPDIPKTTLKQLRKDVSFFCPQCKSDVQLKIGTIKIPHFAHLPNHHCDSLFAEGESAQHLLGKAHLFHLFQRLGYEVELESFLSELNQRPDLLVKNDIDKCNAIEFQCSPIPNDLYLKRTNGYLTNNITPIWIPSTPKTKNLSTGITTISLNENLQKFILSTINQKYLFTYNPDKRQFTYMTNLLHIKDNQYLSKIQHIPLEQQAFPFYVPKNLTWDEFKHYANVYFNLKERYLTYRIHISKKGVNDLFLRSVYELRLSLSEIPIYIGVPLKDNEFFKVCSVEWQAALFYFTHLHRIHIGKLNRQAIQYFLKWAKLNISDESISIVLNYCNLLNQLKIEHAHSSVDTDKILWTLYTQFLA